MRVLIGCEYSGAVRDAFLAAGHEAISCDLLPTEAPGPHYQGDVRNVLDGYRPVSFAAECTQSVEFEDTDELGDICSVCSKDYGADCQCPGPTQDGIEYVERDGVLFGRPQDHPHWDLAVFHPPCTYLSVSGIHWNSRGRGWDQTNAALNFVRLLLDAPIYRIALENPISIISSKIRKPDQIIHPHQFGHDASKATCLWLKNLPLLIPTDNVPPRIVNGKPRWSNQTDSGQNRLGPSPDRWKKRSTTYPGIAAAMAAQWGNLDFEV